MIKSVPTELGITAPRKLGAVTGRSSRSGPFLWILPAGMCVILIFGYSIIDLVQQSFKYRGDWVGFENFSLVLTDPLFRIAIFHNFLLLFTVPILASLSFLCAVLLFETRKGMKFYRSAVFLPYILPIPVIGVVFGQLLQLNGALNSALRAMGFENLALDWLGDPGQALWTMSAIIIWKEVGFGTILILARLISLPLETIEAARIDGAGFFRLHLKVTLPQLKPVILFYIINEAIVMVSWVFNYVYVMTNGQGGPGNATVVSELYIYRSAFQNKSPELAATAALLLLLATLIFIIGFFKIQRNTNRGVFNE
jgi:ABC-type sugar transport system permease subunit